MAQPVAPPSRAGDAERRSVGIFLFDEVEVLDFAGPYEVFSRTRLEPGPVAATGGLRVIPDYSFGDVPEIDIVVVPGGFGTRSMPSAGIDMALTIVARLHGHDAAEETARYMKYRWTSGGPNGD